MSNAYEMWLTRYNLFKDYVVSNAKLPSSDIKFPNGSDLQQWYISQRYRFRKGKLDDEKIKLLNSIIGGILENSASSININIYFKYGSALPDKYDPSIKYLYSEGIVDRTFIEKCIGAGVYVLSDLALKISISQRPYKYIDVFYKCVQSVCKLPNIGICNLYGVLSGEGNILSLYLRDKHRFVDYYSVIFNNFKDDLKKMFKLSVVQRKSMYMLSMRFGLVSGTPETIRNIAIEYELTPSTVSKIINSTLEELRKYVVYDSSGLCTFGRKVRKGSKRKGGQLTVKSIDVDILSNPYNTTFKDINAQNMISNRAYYCLARKGINSFEELHEYLVSVYDGKSADYIKGLYSIKTLGRHTAKEIYDLSLYLGVAEKVFDM